MTTYEMAGQDLVSVIDDTMQAHHAPLVEAGVTVDLMLAYASRDKNGIAKGPAVKHNGLPAYAVVRKMALKDRTAGRSDAEIVLDGDNCRNWDAAFLIAVLYHELYHLELVEDKKEGGIALDDLGRPRLKIRPHDREFGWFDEIAHRHEGFSAEARQARLLFGDSEFQALYLDNKD